MIKSILRKIKKRIKDLILRRKGRNFEELKEIKRKIDKNKVSVFLLQTPTHGNLGDHAIAVAEIQFLNKYLDDKKYQLIEVNQSIHYDFLKYIKVNLDDVLLLHGGGNFGDEYMREEDIRRSVFKKYKNNKIIQFPQTIYYNNNFDGNKEFEITKSLINSCKNLTLIAREKISYNLMNNYYKGPKVLLTPDIVLSMSMNDTSIESRGALMIMRADAEKIISEEDFITIQNSLADKYESIIVSDMQYGKHIHEIKEREKALNDKFKQFQGAEIVITDRLHGMVFAAITGTPCIAFTNYNQKVSGTYDWISNLNYIKYLEDVNSLDKAIDELNNINCKSIFNPSCYDVHFYEILKSIYE